MMGSEPWHLKSHRFLELERLGEQVRVEQRTRRRDAYEALPAAERRVRAANSSAMFARLIEEARTEVAEEAASHGMSTAAAWKLFLGLPKHVAQGLDSVVPRMEAAAPRHECGRRCSIGACTPGSRLRV